MDERNAQDWIDERAKELRTVLHCSCGDIARSLMDWRRGDGEDGGCYDTLNKRRLHRLLDYCKRSQYE
jgi:hypothetical protein